MGVVKLEAGGWRPNFIGWPPVRPCPNPDAWSFFFFFYLPRTVLSSTEPLSPSMSSMQKGMGKARIRTTESDDEGPSPSPSEPLRTPFSRSPSWELLCPRWCWDRGDGGHCCRAVFTGLLSVRIPTWAFVTAIGTSVCTPVLTYRWGLRTHGNHQRSQSRQGLSCSLTGALTVTRGFALRCTPVPPHPPGALTLLPCSSYVTWRNRS